MHNRASPSRMPTTTKLKPIHTGCARYSASSNFQPSVSRFLFPLSLSFYLSRSLTQFRFFLFHFVVRTTNKKKKKKNNNKKPDKQEANGQGSTLEETIHSGRQSKSFRFLSFSFCLFNSLVFLLREREGQDKLCFLLPFSVMIWTESKARGRERERERPDPDQYPWPNDSAIYCEKYPTPLICQRLALPSPPIACTRKRRILSDA